MDGEKVLKKFLSRVSFETWYIMKHLLSDLLGKHHVLLAFNHQVSLGFASETIGGSGPQNMMLSLGSVLIKSSGNC